MPAHGDVLKKIEGEVAQALEMLREKNAGANFEEARGFLREAADAVRNDRFEAALSLAGKAKVAARPTTEYLLGRARTLENQGTEAYQKQDFAAAIKSWNDALQEYGRVREIAGLRGEREVVDSVAAMAKTIEEDSRSATAAKGNREMLDLVSRANNMAGEGKSLYGSARYEEAGQRFKAAAESYLSAANTARDFGFADEPRLREAVSGMQSSIEACYLGKGGQMLDGALKERGAAREKACLEAVEFMKTFSSSNSLYRDLQQRASAGIARSRIEAGARMMAEADALYKKPEYYQAKEAYRRAQEYLHKVSDFAVEKHLEGEQGEVDRLIDGCVANIKACASALINRTPLAGPLPPAPVGDFEGGVAPPQGMGVPVTDAERMAQLEKELGEYREIRWLRPGGANYIAVARDRSGTQVALRLPKEWDRSREQTFFNEARAWGGLRHRNIVRLLQPRTSPPRLELEYLEGGSLKEFLARARTVDKKTACYIANDIARGLEYAHATQGVVHGDLKPSNILLTPTREAKITDWSLGKSYTPGYAAPEQIERQFTDRRTDVYQLGVIFFEMLCGDNPCAHGSIVEMEKKTLSWVPQKPGAHDPELEPLDDLVLRCLSRDPKGRPAIREFRETIYRHMKAYGESLSLTQGVGGQMGALADLATLAAKNNEYADLQGALESLLLKAGDGPARQKVQGWMGQMRHVTINFNTTTRDGVTIFKPQITLPQHAEGKFEVQDGILEDVETMLRSIQHERA